MAYAPHPQLVLAHRSPPREDNWSMCADKVTTQQRPMSAMRKVYKMSAPTQGKRQVCKHANIQAQQTKRTRCKVHAYTMKCQTSDGRRMARQHDTNAQMAHACPTDMAPTCQEK
eukprot:9965961-Alexandrium_andersonii.AAC.1